MPWEDSRLGIYQEECKEKILNLSYVEDNFRMDPPDGEFPDFKLSQVVNIATKLCEEDPNLTNMQLKLIRPYKLKEYQFWRNYFYRVNLLVEAYVEKAEMSKFCENTGVPDNIPIKILSKEQIKNIEKSIAV